MTNSHILENVRQYYTTKILEHGVTAQGVDWKSTDSQVLRFQQLVKLLPNDFFTLNDYGCGYGALIDYLAAQGYDFTYYGLDISEAMVQHARTLYAGRANCFFTDAPEELPVSDFTIASGIFNVKQTTSTADWQTYVLETLRLMNAKSKKGFGFNILTSYSDADKQRADLYYADPLFYFDYCKRNFGKYVALLHDYPLYEFTLLVHKEEAV